MQSIEFSQEYYLQRAEELGISLYLYTTQPIKHSKRSPSNFDFKPRRKSTFDDVTYGKRTMLKPRQKWKEIVHSNKYLRNPWDGYKSSSKRDDDWEWNQPIPETINEVHWSDDEETTTSISQITTPPSTDGGESIGDGKLIVFGDDGAKGNGDVGEAKKNIAPRGKSWMIVTQRMLEEYSK